MARMLYSVTMSLDGFVAGPGDDPHRGTDRQGKPFGGGWSGPQVVLTHHVPADPVEGVTFVGDLAGAVAAARDAAGDRYVNILGADTARQCLEADALDEVLVLVAPVMLGGGVRLFDRPGGEPVRLERVSVSQAPLATNLLFRVLR